MKNIFIIYITLLFNILNAQISYVPIKINEKYGIRKISSKNHTTLYIQPIYDTISALNIDNFGEIVKTSYFLCKLKNSFHIIGKGSTIIYKDSNCTAFNIYDYQKYFGLHCDEKGLIALIDKKSQKLTKLDTSFVSRDDEYSTAVQIFKSRNKYGITYLHKVLLEPIYDTIKPYGNQSFLVSLKNKFGLYSLADEDKPNMILPCIYDKINLLSKVNDKNYFPPPPIAKKNKKIVWEGILNKKVVKIKDYDTREFRIYMMSE